VKKIKTNCYHIEVTIDENGRGSITSELHDKAVETPMSQLFNAAMDAVESMVLAHACAGVDITAPAYIEGIETAVEAMANHFGDD